VQGLMSAKSTNAGSFPRTSSSSQYAAAVLAQKAAEVHFSVAKTAKPTDQQSRNTETGNVCSSVANHSSVAAVAVSKELEAAAASQANLAKHLAIQIYYKTYAHTGHVQVVCQLDCHIHLHGGLEDAAAEQCLVVGLLRLGLDGRLHPALGDVRGDGAGPAHGSPVARPVHHGVLLLRAPNGNSFCRVARTKWYADFVLQAEGVHFCTRVPSSEDLKSIKIQVAAICHWNIFKISSNLIAKSKLLGCSAGSTYKTLNYKLILQAARQVLPRRESTNFIEAMEAAFTDHS
jgi:hypothetical protein